MSGTIVYWLTGLSGSGKTTIANGFKEEMEKYGKTVRILDGDDIRGKKHQHLDFSLECIKENNRLIAELCKGELGKYDYILVSVISPFEDVRKQSRRIIGPAYHEVYIKASLDAVKQRDPKGLYKKALDGQIDNFIGISKNVPYEIPVLPDIVLDTEKSNSQECIECLINQAEGRYAIE